MDFNNLCKHMVRHPEKLQFLNPGAITTFKRIGLTLPEHLIMRMEPKSCYSNAAKVAEYISYSTDFDVYYAEGITSVFNQIPIHHAFVIINVEGINWILDPTMEYALEKSEEDIFKEQYVLVDFWPASEIHHLMLAHQKWGPWSPEL